jgi:hypothetical protein
MTPRRAGTTAAAASRIDQDVAAVDSGGAGPGLGPDGPIRRCARRFTMTAGSCSVAISRSRPPAMRARQNVDRERPVHERRPAPGARTALRLCALRACDQRRRHGRELGHHASVRDHARANGPARPTDHGRSAGLSPAAASSPRAAPATPAARTPALACRRARASSAPARCARRAVAAAPGARGASRVRGWQLMSRGGGPRTGRPRRPSVLVLTILVGSSVGPTSNAN